MIRQLFQRGFAGPTGEANVILDKNSLNYGWDSSRNARSCTVRFSYTFANAPQLHFSGAAYFLARLDDSGKPEVKLANLSQGN
jgi:hypothetical protein